MSWLLFVDETGIDRRESLYEVLAGVAVHDSDLWNLIQAVHAEEERHFGRRISAGGLELKARKLLKRKVFRLASQRDPIDPDERRLLAASCLAKGDTERAGGQAAAVTLAELTALAQAKVAFVETLLVLCARYHVRAFASIVHRDAPRTAGDFLRKDYAYLFERLYYFLDEQVTAEMGLVVFDELERSQCHVLIDQLGRYFRETTTGRSRASRVIPEPFFVHSDLTTAIQLADVVAYVIAQGVRVGTMTEPARAELSQFAALVCNLRHRSTQTIRGNPLFEVWSFAVIDDLRPRSEQLAAQQGGGADG
ncbi:MAG: DUF3800 domain-containing protein [Deltaproteobacteria bacterium]|nr:DUF3800 domain-containing protein [Deltaproteobacteria bacterium]